MIAVLVFALGPLAEVLVSERAGRTVLSTAVIFLALGFVTGTGVLDLVVVRPGDPGASRVAEIALFVVFYTDGMHVGLCEIRRAWRLPGRRRLSACR